MLLPSLPTRLSMDAVLAFLLRTCISDNVFVRTVIIAHQPRNGRNARLKLRRQPTAKKLHHVTSGDSRGRRLTTWCSFKRLAVAVSISAVHSVHWESSLCISLKVAITSCHHSAGLVRKWTFTVTGQTTGKALGTWQGTSGWAWSGYTSCATTRSVGKLYCWSIFFSRNSYILFS